MIRRLFAALASMVALAAMLVGLPVVLWVLGRQWLPDHIPTLTEIWTVLGRPDDGSLFAGALVLIGFGVWACLLFGFLIELPSQLGLLRHAVRMPTGLGWSQQVAGGLLAVVLSLAVSQVASATEAPASAQMTTQAAVGPVYTEPVATPTPAPPAAPTAPVASTYTVVRGDTLWQIAETTLGDGIRYTEILDLNRAIPQADGGALTAAGDINEGWVLALPADAVPAPAGATVEVVVEAGDTLSEIATEQGLPSWQPIFAANAGEVQPGGRLFTDPDLIFPGQALDIPDPGAATAPPAPAPDPEVPPAEPEPVPAPPVHEPIPDGQPAPPPERPAGGQESAGSGEQDTQVTAAAAGGSADLATVLAGGGTLLAAGIGARFWMLRRRRYRGRRPGNVLAATPAALVPVEAAVLTCAKAGDVDFEAVGMALRSLGVAVGLDPEAALPDVLAARLGPQRLELRFSTPARGKPPQPWMAEESGWWWSVDLRAEFPISPAQAQMRLAPYPVLASIGQDDEGRRWMLDLERIGALSVTGPPQLVEDFYRHLVAELAVNGWSDQNEITMVGFGSELVDLHPWRINYVEDLDAAAAKFLNRVQQNRESAVDCETDVLTGRMRAIAGDMWMPAVLVVAPHLESDSGAVAALRAGLGAQADRIAVAVLSGGTAAVPAGGWDVEMTADGRLRIPELDLTVRASQLTAEQGGDIAALVAFERDTSDAPMPPAAGDQQWQAVTDAAGALLPEVTLPRAPAPAGEGSAQRLTAEDRAPWAPQVPGSVLPHSTDTYLASSPASVEDIEVLAPRAAPEVAERVEEELSQLDRDLADWWDPNCPRPRLSLLGPVMVRPPAARGATGEVVRRGRSEEVIAYLATRPHGATVDEMAEALRPSADDPANARSWVYRASGDARTWLGSDPDSGQFYLSRGKRGPYVLNGVLVDEVLFRQLRCRSGIRGRDGFGDLQAALELVTGAPFGQRPASGYEWLAGLDQTFTAMICDVAHLVVASAVTDKDPQTARTASNTALLVAPQDDKVLLDAMCVAFLDGNPSEGEAFITRIVEVNGGEYEDLTTSKAKLIERAREAYLARAS